MNQSWFAVIETIKVKDGLAIPEVFALFESEAEADGSIRYVPAAENIVVEEQSVLDSAAKTDWFISLDSFKIKDGLLVPENIAAFEQGEDNGYIFYSKEKVRADSLSVLDSVAAASWLSSVNVIEVKNGLTVPSAITQSYTLVYEGDYNVYIKGTITAESQQFLDYILSCDWLPELEVLKVNEALTITQTYDAFKQGTTDGYSIYTKEKVAVDTQEFLNTVADASWLSSVNVLLVKDGLSVPQKIANEFEAVVSANTDYTTYYRTEIMAVSNEFLVSIQNEIWIPDVTLLKVKSGVRVVGNLYYFSQGTIDGYTYYTAEKVTISGQDFMNTAKDKEWFSSVNVLAIHYTYSIPEELVEGFISVGYNSSYYYYVRAEMNVFSQAFLNYVSAQSWLTTSVESLTIQDGLTVPSQISENFTAGESVDGFTTYTRNAS